LRTIKWSGCLPKPVTDSGGEKIAVSSPVKTVASPGPTTTATMTDAPQSQAWSSFDGASDYAPTPSPNDLMDYF
ncbi:hypothetical protein LINGRAHAP2_LOCUS30128, partial [Linum grandiflorum]